MPSVFQHDDGCICSHQLGLLPQRVSQGFVAADAQNGHGQFGLRELSEILGRLQERDEVSPARMHPPWACVGRCVSSAIRLWNRMSLVGRKVIPEVVEVNTLAT